MDRSRSLSILTCGLLVAALAAPPGIGTRAARAEAEILRVGTSGDYPPFSRVDPSAGSGYAGLDVALAEAYAADRGLQLEWVRFRWPQLAEDLASGRFDVAMSGVTLRPDRTAAGSFTVPIVESGAVALTLDGVRFPSPDRLDRSHVRLGVNAGGHLEAVARSQFPRATLIAIPENDAVLRALLEGGVDAVVTETHEANLWQRDLEGAKRLGPFTRDRKAWWVRPDLSERVADLDAWLLEREADGALARMRTEYLGSGQLATAEPLRALFAALDERLSLMPLVAIVKRRSGVPLEVPERETQVLDAAVGSLMEAAKRTERPAPAADELRGLFRAQMEAAKQVQWSAVKSGSPAPATSLPDLDAVLRPALLRVGDRVVRLVLALPPRLDSAEVREVADSELRTPHLSNQSRRELANAVARLDRPEASKQPESAQRVNIRAPSPASTGNTRQTP